MKDQQLKEWEKEFDKKFGSPEFGGQYLLPATWDFEIKNFINSHFVAKSEVREMIGNLKKVNVCLCHINGGYAVCCEECKNSDCLGRRGYNSALSDLLKLLDK